MSCQLRRPSFQDIILERHAFRIVYGVRNMTEHIQLAGTPRESFLEAAQKELIAFERREREFSKKERQERAAELQFPALEKELRS